MSIFGDNFFSDEIFSAFAGCRLCEKPFEKYQPTIVTEIGKVHTCCNLDIRKWREYFSKKGASK